MNIWFVFVLCWFAVLLIPLRDSHRRTSRGDGDCSPLTKTISFCSKGEFFGQKPAAKKEKSEFIPSSEIKCPKAGISTNKYWVGCVGQINFVGYSNRLAVFGRCRKNFRAIMAFSTKNWPVCLSDVKRGQNLEAETEAEARALKPRPRPRPELWGQGRQSRVQFLDVDARPRTKIKLWIKKVSIWWLTTYRRIYIIVIQTTQFNFSFSLAQFYLLTYCDVLVSRSLLGCWFFCCRRRPGRGQMFEAKAEAEANVLRPRPMPRPKCWPRGHFGLEDLTSLVCLWWLLRRTLFVDWE